MALTISAAAAQSMGNGPGLVTTIGAAALIRIYTASRPATPETAISGQTLLATITLSGSFSSTGGVLTASDPAAVTIAASGTAAWFRLLAASGPTAILDGTVTATGGGGDMTLATVSLSSGATLDLGVPTITVPLS